VTPFSQAKINTGILQLELALAISSTEKPSFPLSISIHTHHNRENDDLS